MKYLISRHFNMRVIDNKTFSMFLLFLKIILLFDVFGWFPFMPVHVCLVPSEAIRGCQIPGIGVTDGGELPYMVAGN